MSNCFACGHRLLNINLPCPKCGYIFDTDVSTDCPNKNKSVCELTGKPCDIEGHYNTCEIKERAEKEAGY